jgi:hypothetical protein
MAFILRDVVKKLFVNGYMWTGNPTKDDALNWAKTCIVQPQGATTKSSANGAIPITHSYVSITTGAASAYTLADGTAGQELAMSVTTDGGAGTITPVTATGWATAVLTVVGDGLTLRYVDDTVGWIVIGAYGTTSSTAATVITL